MFSHSVALLSASLSYAQAPLGRVIFGSDGSGIPAQVRGFHYPGAVDLGTFVPDETDPGAAAVGGGGDVDGDGIGDVVMATGQGGGGRPVRIRQTTSTGLNFRPPWEPFPPGADYGPISVATGDINGDGLAEIITGGSLGDGSHITVFDPLTGNMGLNLALAPLGPSRRINVAPGDINGDGRDEIIVGRVGPGTGPQVKIFNGSDGTEIGSFFAFPGMNTGITVATLDIDGDGMAEIMCGSEDPIEGSGLVRVFGNGDPTNPVLALRPFPGLFTGVNVASGDMDGDGFAELVFGARAGGLARVMSNGRFDDIFSPFGTAYTGGVNVAASSVPEPSLGFSAPALGAMLSLRRSRKL